VVCTASCDVRGFTQDDGQYLRGRPDFERMRGLHRAAAKVYTDFSFQKHHLSKVAAANGPYRYRRKLGQGRACTDGKFEAFSEFEISPGMAFYPKLNTH
jgi:hypothetical protein